MMLQKNASVADHWLRFLIVWCYDRAQINCIANLMWIHMYSRKCTLQKWNLENLYEHYELSFLILFAYEHEVFLMCSCNGRASKSNSFWQDWEWGIPSLWEI
jgi:hypothetical protein